MMTMQTEMSVRKLEDDCPRTMSHADFTCDTCGKTLQKSILARVLSGGGVQTYQACPHCLTRIHIAQAKKQDRKPEPLRKGSSEFETKLESSFTCGHFFGYLNKRQKGTPIPEPCFVCIKMVECLSG
jgi:hypothetical protein